METGRPAVAGQYAEDAQTGWAAIAGGWRETLRSRLVSGRDVSEPRERTSPSPPLPVRFIGKALTRIVARAPWTWPVMRRPVRGFFDRLADGWDQRVRPDAPEHLAALAAAVSRLEAPPAGALDLGTGTGAGALWLARQFPEARVRAWTSRRR